MNANKENLACHELLYFQQVDCDFLKNIFDQIYWLKILKFDTRYEFLEQLAIP